jgi:putative FmdB family regulatory protein
MAIYEYYCPTCKERFEQRRPMSEARDVVTCGRGHKAERTISAFAVARGGVAMAEAPVDMGEGGGCCGGGACACGN